MPLDPAWRFDVGILPEGCGGDASAPLHVVAVARGPPTEAVDAWGGLKATMADPTAMDDHLPPRPWRVMNVKRDLLPPAAAAAFSGDDDGPGGEVELFDCF